jgi:hypothetical protein
LKKVKLLFCERLIQKGNKLYTKTNGWLTRIGCKANNEKKICLVMVGGFTTMIRTVMENTAKDNDCGLEGAQSADVWSSSTGSMSQ